jgi:hypothetical protein
VERESAKLVYVLVRVWAKKLGLASVFETALGTEIPWEMCSEIW